jgi:hypothetical protein
MRDLSLAMQREQVHNGLVVKLLTDYFNVPAGTNATVFNAIATMSDGTWYFTVRWQPYIPIPNEFPSQMTECSLTLWERDLEMFEIVSAEEAAGKWKPESGPSITRPSVPQLSGGWKARRQGRVHPNQLSLFVTDDL